MIATKFALKLGDYVVTEAGFGADLGAEKFLDIKCRVADLKPDAVVCVATLKALKYNGGVPKELVKEENVEAVKKGMPNLLKHVQNLKEQFGLNVIVAINKHPFDTEAEIQCLEKALEEKKIQLSLVESWEKGGEGAEDLAEKIINLVEEKENFQFIYETEDPIQTKLEKVAKKIYGAENVEYSEEALQTIQRIEALGFGNFPVCIAKTQYSLSDDPKNLACKEPFTIHINEVILKGGAEFIVAITGKMMTMPGLPKVPAAEKIDVDKEGNVVGIF